MRSAIVKINNSRVGTLQENTHGYVFMYDGSYLLNPAAQPLSLTMPLREEPYNSRYLFPFFVSLLSEGANRQAQCRLLRIDPDDDFGLLLETAAYDTIGNVTIEKQ